MLREELQLLQEQGSYVGEVVKPMDKKKVLVKVRSMRREPALNLAASHSGWARVERCYDTPASIFAHFSAKVHPEGKFVVDIDKNIDIANVTPNSRVALRNDSYTLHKILPNKVSLQELQFWHAPNDARDFGRKLR